MEKYYTFYEKNHYEDCYPYRDDELLLISDGLGGSGRAKFNIDPNLIDSIEKIYDAVLPEDKNHDFETMIKTQFSDIYNNPTVVRTSAFWGSRIISTRALYAIKKISTDPEEMKNFIVEGLAYAVKKLKIDVPKQVDLLTFPATLVVVNIINKTENKVTIDVYHAGDSRAYLISKDGMQQLTKDHEDEGGAMSNLLCFNKDDCYIEKKTYTLTKPFILALTSDGIFDILNPLSLELNFLLAICESDSIENAGEKLKRFYNQNKRDDCTLVMESFGFENYEACKKKLKSRKDSVYNLYLEQNKYSDYLKVLDNKEDYQWNYKSIFNNFKKRFSILKEIIQNNPFYDEEKKEYIETIIKSKKRKKLIYEIDNIFPKEYIENNEVFKIREEIFDFDSKIQETKSLKNKYIDILKELRNTIENLFVDYNSLFITDEDNNSNKNLFGNIKIDIKNFSINIKRIDPNDIDKDFLTIKTIMGEEFFNNLVQTNNTIFANEAFVNNKNNSDRIIGLRTTVFTEINKIIKLPIFKSEAKKLIDNYSENEPSDELIKNLVDLLIKCPFSDIDYYFNKSELSFLRLNNELSTNSDISKKVNDILDKNNEYLKKIMKYVEE